MNKKGSEEEWIFPCRVCGEREIYSFSDLLRHEKFEHPERYAVRFKEMNYDNMKGLYRELGDLLKILGKEEEGSKEKKR